MSAEYTTQTPSPPICLTCFVSVDYLGSTQLLTDSSGLVVPDLMYSFFAEVAKGISDRVRPSGYQVVISISEEDPTIEREERRFCLELGKQFPDYGDDLWGITRPAPTNSLRTLPPARCNHSDNE